MKFLHAAAFSPVKSTWLKAIKIGFFNTWTGLNQENVRKYLEKSIATEKGHMDEEGAGTRSTTRTTDDEQSEITTVPKQETRNRRTP